MQGKDNRNNRIYLGFDVSEKSIEVFGIRGEQTTEKTIKIANNKESIQSLLTTFDRNSPVSVVMETGTHSAWMSRYIRTLGFDAIVAHARDLALIYNSNKKKR